MMTTKRIDIRKLIVTIIMAIIGISFLNAIHLDDLCII